MKTYTIRIEDHKNEKYIETEAIGKKALSAVLHKVEMKNEALMVKDDRDPRGYRHVARYGVKVS